MLTSTTLIVSGLVCLVAWGFILRKLMPQEGKPPSAWVGTDARGTSVAIGLIVMLLAGLGMLVKGIV